MKRLLSIFIFIIFFCNIYSQGVLDASFRPESNNIVVGQCIYFVDESTGNPTYWKWRFPGSETEEFIGREPRNICYNQVGTFDVFLEIQNATGVNTEVIRNCIEVVADPTRPAANFTADYLVIPAGQMINFSDASLNGPFVAHRWKFQGGRPDTSNVANPESIVYIRPGVYDVTLEVEDGEGRTSRLVKRNYITVTTNAVLPPVADFVANRVFIAPNSVVDFTDLSKNNPYKWEWKFPGAAAAYNTSTEKSPYGILYPTAGTYDVQLIVDNGISRDTIIKEGYIVVSTTDPCLTNPTLSPLAGFTSTNRLIRSGERVIFVDTSLNTTLWYWEFDGGSPGTMSTSSAVDGIRYTSAGFYDVYLAASNNCNQTNYVLKEDYVMVFTGPIREHCNTQSNMGDNEGVYSPGITGTWGKVGGHNGQKVRSYAEHFSQYQFTQVRGLEIAIAKSKAKNTQTSYIDFYIWDGNSEFPETVLATKRILMKNMPENFWTYVEFDEPVDVSGPFFAGYQLTYASGANTSDNNDEFAVSIAYTRGSSGRNTFYVQESNGTWKSIRDKFSISTSAAIVPKSCIVEVETFDIDNNIAVFPNPTSERVYIQTGDLPMGKKVTIQLFDMTGKILSSETTKVNGQNIEINVNNYPEGLYFINMMVDQFRVTRKIMVAR